MQAAAVNTTTEVLGMPDTSLSRGVRLYQTAPALHTQFAWCPPLCCLLFPPSSKEFSVRSERSGGLCSHVAREQLILCAHSACRQSAGHNGSPAGYNTTTHAGALLSGSAALALAFLLRNGQLPIPLDKSFHLVAAIVAVRLLRGKLASFNSLCDLLVMQTFAGIKLQLLRRIFITLIISSAY